MKEKNLRQKRYKNRYYRKSNKYVSVLSNNIDMLIIVGFEIFDGFGEVAPSTWALVKWILLRKRCWWFLMYAFSSVSVFVRNIFLKALSPIRLPRCCRYLSKMSLGLLEWAFSFSLSSVAFFLLCHFFLFPNFPPACVMLRWEYSWHSSSYRKNVSIMFPHYFVDPSVASVQPYPVSNYTLYR